jgi:hypothetical protein
VVTKESEYLYYDYLSLVAMGQFEDLLPHVQKREDNDIRRFADFLFSYGIKKVTILDKPDETLKGTPKMGNFDYLVQLDGKERAAIELTQIFEKEEDRLRSMQWGNLTSAFNDELKGYRSKFGKFKWTGIWNVETPENFGASLTKSKVMARKNVKNLLNALEKDESLIKLGPWALKLRKVTEQGVGTLFFSTSPEAGGIDPSKDIEPKLREQLLQKNQQLSVDGARRILVMINRYIFGETSEMISAFSRIDEIWKYENIDEIFYEESPGRFVLVFSNELRRALNSDTFLLNESFFGPFQLWILHLRKNNPASTFRLIKNILDRTGREPYELFHDDFAREEIVQLGEWLIEQKRLEEAMWLIDRFINDPNPPESDSQSSFDYSDKIARGEDPHAITTVLGSLAWVVQRLALQKDGCSAALAYVGKLLSHRNLYVKQQAVFPLIEIAARRQWLDGYGKRPYDRTYKEFRETVFSLVALVEDNVNCKAIAKLLCHVFSFYKDLSTEEVMRVLNALQIVEESAGLFIYFGVFREKHFKDQNIPFDGEKAKRKLIDLIEMKNGDQGLQIKAIWLIWRTLNQNRDTFETLKPYVYLFLNQLHPFRREFYHYIEFIVKDWIQEKPDICIDWFESMLKQICTVISTPNQARVGAGFFLHHAKDIVDVVAKQRPNKLEMLLKLILNLWKRGVYVGNLEQLFEAVNFVLEENGKLKIGRRLQKLRDSIKET